MEFFNYPILVIGALFILLIIGFNIALSITKHRIETFEEYWRRHEIWLKASYKELLVDKHFTDYCLIYYEINLENSGKGYMVEKIRQWRFANRARFDTMSTADVSRELKRL